jgi:hypothetical protein
MPTENRRVATYLPKRIDDQLEAFKVERGLKGDSPALIAILEMFFGVSQKVAHISSSEAESLSQRIEAVEQSLTQMKIDILDDLPSELSKLLFFWKAEVRDDLLSELKSELPDIIPVQQLEANTLEEVDGQLSFLDAPFAEDSESDTPNKLLANQTEKLKIVAPKPLAGVELSERLGVNKGVVSKVKTKKDPQHFAEWSKSKDPDGFAWEFEPDTKLYYPILPQQEGQVDAEEF